MVLVTDMNMYVGIEWECRHTEMERSENWGEFLYIKEYLLSIWPYSPNYAVPTLGIYREEYYLIEMSIPRNSWLANNFSHGEIEFGLNGYIAPEYKASIRIRADIFVIQARNYNNRSILPMSISLLF